MFVDHVDIIVRSGDGGRGSLSFRHEKYVPRGGPDGGDGGRGGNVVLAVDSRLSTLQDFRRKRVFKAMAGGAGRGGLCHGRRGEDLVIPVPPGTLVRDQGTGDLLADLIVEGEQATVCVGGRGGRGNARFTAPNRRAPRTAELGEPGQERRLALELRLLADVGLVGLPNAGKSSLLAAATAARPQVAAYPFTTITPNLGVVTFEQGASFVLADVPGLIEGAHEGKGLGHRFLQHLERTRVLVAVVDLSAEDPYQDLAAMRREVSLYSTRLAERPWLVAGNKCDLPEALAYWPDFAHRLESEGVETLPISAHTGEGVARLLERVEEILAALPKPEEGAREVVAPQPTTLRSQEWRVIPDGSVFRVVGVEVERRAAMTDPDDEDAIVRLYRYLRRCGALRALRRAGVQEGDLFLMGERELIFRSLP